MKSQFGEKFNHDPYASEYDDDVKNESDPIRAGYQALQDWIGAHANSSSCIVDLGCGTGNTINSVNGFERAYCVDLSQNMLDVAKSKLDHRKGITYVKSDLLDFFQIVQDPEIDTVISSYAIHHLTQPEKHQLFEAIFLGLKKGGKVVFGDLMFESREGEKKLGEKYPEQVETFEDEFFWYVDEEVLKLKELGFAVEEKRFSDLSWGIMAKK